MIRTFKRKLVFTKEQSERMDSWIGCCRLIYNMGLEIKKKTYEKTGKSIHRFELQKQLTTIKDIPFVKDAPSKSLQCVIKRLENNFQIFFRHQKRGGVGGYPKFASKKTYKSIDLPTVSVHGNFVKILKMGNVRMFNDSPIAGTPKAATIIKDLTGYFICIQCENVPKKFNSDSQDIGLDMGISHFCIDSNGIFIENPKHFKSYESKLRIENRSLARKKKGSNSWRKQAKKLALLHHKIANVRKDFLHKESTAIAKRNSIVYMEDLNIAGMSKNKNLSKHILDCGWGSFRRMLEYKTSVIRIPPMYTSQTCFGCGNVNVKNRISQSEFRCTSCGYALNADVNAAKNIKSKGIALERKRKAIA